MGNKFRKAIGDLREPDFPSKEYLLCKVQKGRGRGGAGALRPVPCHSPLASLNKLVEQNFWLNHMVLGEKKEADKWGGNSQML